MHLLSKHSHRAGFIFSALLVSVETKSLDRKGTLRMRKQASCLEPGNGGLENSNTSCAGIWKYVGIYYSFSQQMPLGFSWALALYHAGDMHACVLAKSLSCARLFATPWTCSPPGFSVHGILQARVLEWVAISSFRGSFPPRDGS